MSFSPLAIATPLPRVAATRMHQRVQPLPPWVRRRALRHQVEDRSPAARKGDRAIRVLLKWSAGSLRVANRVLGNKEGTKGGLDRFASSAAISSGCALTKTMTSPDWHAVAASGLLDMQAACEHLTHAKALHGQSARCRPSSLAVACSRQSDYQETRTTAGDDAFQSEGGSRRFRPATPPSSAEPGLLCSIPPGQMLKALTGSTSVRCPTPPTEPSSGGANESRHLPNSSRPCSSSRCPDRFGLGQRARFHTQPMTSRPTRRRHIQSRGGARKVSGEDSQ